MLAWYRELIRLRRTTPALNDGEPGHTRVLYDQQEMRFSIHRGDVTLCCNLGETERRFPVPEGGEVVLSSRGVATAQDGVVIVPPDTAVIYQSQRN